MIIWWWEYLGMCESVKMLVILNRTPPMQYHINDKLLFMLLQKIWTMCVAMIMHT